MLMRSRSFHRNNCYHGRSFMLMPWRLMHLVIYPQPVNTGSSVPSTIPEVKHWVTLRHVNIHWHVCMCVCVYSNILLGMSWNKMATFLIDIHIVKRRMVVWYMYVRAIAHVYTPVSIHYFQCVTQEINMATICFTHEWTPSKCHRVPYNFISRVVKHP